MTKGLYNLFLVFILSILVSGCGEDGGIELPSLRPSVPVITGITSEEGCLTITWTKSQNASSYDVYMASKPWEWEDKTLVSRPDDMKYETTESSFKNCGLVNGQLYYFLVKARNSVGDSRLSNMLYGEPSVSGDVSAMIIKNPEGLHRLLVSGKPVKDAYEYFVLAGLTWITGDPGNLTLTSDLGFTVFAVGDYPYFEVDQSGNFAGPGTYSLFLVARKKDLAGEITEIRSAKISFYVPGIFIP